MRIEAVEAGELERLNEQILQVYASAFAPPPYSRGTQDLTSFSVVFNRHTERAGFRFFGAFEPSQDRLVGFAYGYTSQAGQWWHDQVASALSPAAAAEWLLDAFELVELAVLPEYQGQGAGGRLHDRILGELPHRTALLSTLQAETNGLKLYRRRGWVVLIDGFRFAGFSRTYLIMGRQLRVENGL